MPFLLRRCLMVTHIKDLELASLQRQLIDPKKSHSRISSPVQAINALISCWVAVAKAACLCFSFVFTEQLYRDLKDALRVESAILIKVKCLFLYLYVKLSLYYFISSNNSI